MVRVLVFNPEHDYALSVGEKTYTAPLSISVLASKMEMLPLIWAEENDLILRADNTFVENTREGLRMLSTNEIDFGIIHEVAPWGWDLKIKSRLLKLGVKDGILPSDEQIENVRRLSHRRISISCNRYVDSPFVPVEFFNQDDAINFAKNNPGCYFKMPWSGGGRGVLATKELNGTQINEWISGCLRRQGSILAEPYIDRALDFATLWEIDPLREVRFSGYSVSLSDGRGKYDGNLYGSQSEIYEYITKHSDLDLDSSIKKQKEFIQHEIAPHYSGLLGIDMALDKSGILYPCIEINLRRTMGHVALAFSKLNIGRQKELKFLNPPLIPLS